MILGLYLALQSVLSLLVVLRGPYEVPGIRTMSASQVSSFLSVRYMLPHTLIHS